MRFKLKILFYLIQVKMLKFWYRNNLTVLRKLRFRKLLKIISKTEYYKFSASPKAKLEDFPLINKQLFMSNFNAINTCNIKLDDAYKVAIKAEKDRDFSPTINGITIGLSSGTSGNRGVFMANENERAMWVAMMLDRVIGFSFKKRSVAFFLRANSNLYSSVKSSVLSFNFFDLLDDLPNHIRRLNLLQPTILVAQPSMLMELAQAIEKNELNINPSKVISVAEVLTNEDKSYLTAVFKQIIHQVYQCTEGFLASSCKMGRLHFNEDFLIIEKKYIDNEKVRFHPIITDLKRSSQPVIRYELNDIIIAQPFCECGSKMMVIASIEGRSDDMLEFINTQNVVVKIFPDFFRRAIIMADVNITDYAIIQTEYNQLKLYIESENSTSYGLASQAVHQLLLNYGIENITITAMKDRNHIQGNKLRRVRNDIRKTN